VHGYEYLNFATEDTRIAAPEPRSLARFMEAEDVYPDGFRTIALPYRRLPWPESWSHYTATQSERKVGPIHEFYDATSAELLVYRVGMAAAKYYKETIERQRRGRPASLQDDPRSCGGYLVWKLHDSWPQIYSAKVDYFLEPLIPYYAIRRAFSPVLVSIEVSTRIRVWIVNDTGDPIAGTLVIRDYSLLGGSSRHATEVSVAAGPDASVCVLDLTDWGTLDRRTAIGATLTGTDGQTLATAGEYLDIERNLPFPDATLRLACHGDSVEISSDMVARSVVLTGSDGGDEFGWRFEDNYFDLVPGVTRRVRVLGRHNHGTVTARALYSSQATSIEYSSEKS
jgi:hypothetical protein